MGYLCVIISCKVFFLSTTDPLAPYDDVDPPLLEASYPSFSEERRPDRQVIAAVAIKVRRRQGVAEVGADLLAREGVEQAGVGGRQQVHLQAGQTDRQTDRQTDVVTRCADRDEHADDLPEQVARPRSRDGDVKVREEAASRNRIAQILIVVIAVTAAADVVAAAAAAAAATGADPVRRLSGHATAIIRLS